MAHRGFTLKELLAVVAIVAILAAIQPPPGRYHAEAMRRARYPRTRSDLRWIRDAVNAYFTDQHAYPPGIPLDGQSQAPGRVHRLGGGKLTTINWGRLTTPVCYVGADPSSRVPGDVYTRVGATWAPLAYHADESGFIVFSAGPNGRYELTDPAAMIPRGLLGLTSGLPPADWMYDPTNGAESAGDLFRLGSASR